MTKNIRFWEFFLLLLESFIKLNDQQGLRLHQGIGCYSFQMTMYFSLKMKLSRHNLKSRVNRDLNFRWREEKGFKVYRTSFCLLLWLLLFITTKSQSISVWCLGRAAKFQLQEPPSTASFHKIRISTGP